MAETVADAIVQLLAGKLKAGSSTVDVATIGAKDFDDGDELALDLPAVRVRYDSSGFGKTTNSGRVYNAKHLIQLWVAAENLRSMEDQRSDSLALATHVMAHVVGVKLQLADGSQSDPVEILGMQPLPDDNIGILYIISLAVAGSAQFPGGQ